MDSPTLQRRRLAKALKRAREAAGMTQEQAGKAIDGAKSKISRVEAAQSGFRVTDLNVLIELYGVDEVTAARMRELARAGRRRGRWSAYRNVTPDWFTDYLDLEDDASTIRWYKPEVVPGVLQTEAYIRAVFTTAAPRRADDEVERLVRVRLERQAVLDRRRTQSHFILSESVLRRVVGNPTLMANQALHIAEIAEYSNVDVQILPFNAQTYCPASVVFTMLRFDDNPSTDVVYLEDYTDADYLDDEAPVRAYTDLWNRLSAAALGQVESQELLREIAGEHKHPKPK
ncbi:helix-turn-helix protein [Herbihabitans rhizosphaerae]|uniref:Helix-turn-helix protein n=1 Tax=Herbihabitans rhizosphaerae TaxID=1872711 RepID=A0A4Q7L4C0_9PSEU|nr:helix-turn-helix transcriptional regulator [Herbihabitans rhizosphaerae]RZS43042.1 helix-turn-helix protein [Herbihabitans rhizosphaerae]